MIKLQALAARFYYRDKDDFTLLEDQMRTVAELILENCVMTQKEQVRIVSAQCLSTMIPMMSEQDPRKNLFFKSATLFQAYMILMNALVFVLTDENPQIRLFMQNQSIRQMLG